MMASIFLLLLLLLLKAMTIVLFCSQVRLAVRMCKHLSNKLAGELCCTAGICVSSFSTRSISEKFRPNCLTYSFVGCFLTEVASAPKATHKSKPSGPWRLSGRAQKIATLKPNNLSRMETVSGASKLRSSMGECPFSYQRGFELAYWLFRNIVFSPH